MPTKMEGRSDKVAFLLFTATLNSGGPSPLTLSCISEPIHLSKYTSLAVKLKDYYFVITFLLSIACVCFQV